MRSTNMALSTNQRTFKPLYCTIYLLLLDVAKSLLHNMAKNPKGNAKSVLDTLDLSHDFELLLLIGDSGFEAF